jgi:hypothetical protein
VRVSLFVAAACAGIAACSRGPGGNWMQLALNRAGVICLGTLRTHVMDRDHAIAIAEDD